MRRMMASALMLGCALVLPGRPPQALADTLPFASGVESNTGVQTCAGWSHTPGSAGLYFEVSDECTKHYSIPLYWRNFWGAGVNRTITVRGRRGSASARLDCRAMVFNSAGVLVSSDLKEFPYTGSSYSTISLTVNNVVSSGSSFVICNQELSAGHRLLNISWTP